MVRSGGWRTWLSGRALAWRAAGWVVGLVPLVWLGGRVEQSADEVTSAEKLLGVWYAVWMVYGAALLWVAGYVAMRPWKRRRARRAV